MVISHNKNHFFKWFFTITMSLCAAITTSAQATSTVTIDVSEDTYIRSGSYSAVNYNDKGIVEIRDISNLGGGARIGVLKFTVPDLGAVIIDSAILKLKFKKTANEEAPVSQIDVKLLNGSDRNNWIEGTGANDDGSGITWDNAPNLTDTTVLASKDITGDSGAIIDTWYDFNVSTGITQPGTYTLLISTNTVSKTQVQFYSKTASGGAYAADLELTFSAQPLITGIDVSPSHVHVVAPLVGDANKLVQQVTVVNNEAVAVSITGVTNESDPGFIIDNNNCGTLAPGASCTFTVEAGNNIDDPGVGILSPDFGFINVTSDSSVTSTFPIFVSQIESDQQQAIRAAPAVVTDITVIDDLTGLAPVGTLLPTQSYTVNFSMQGYDEGYETFAALFACATTNNSCAESASDILVWNKESTEISVTDSDFLYKTATSQSFQYSITLTMPEYGEDYAASDAIVLRFYQRGQLDVSQDNGSNSAIIPGGQGLDMIGKLGRKIIIWQQPE